MQPAIMELELELENAVLELLADFNEVLRREGRPDFSLLESCPEPYRRELLSLMNVAALAYRALAPERTARCQRVRPQVPQRVTTTIRLAHLGHNEAAQNPRRNL